MPVLRNTRYEIFAQDVAAGKSPKQAYLDLGGKSKNPSISGNGLLKRPEIRARVDEILTRAANRAELSRKDILDRIFQDWELARKLGQVPAALKAAELMGKELHKMFVERKEIGQAGDFDAKTEDELKEIIREGLKDLGMEDLPSKAIN